MESLISDLKTLIVKAGEIAKSKRKAGPSVSFKSDGSPVTDADSEISFFIYSGLKNIAPGIPVICEEREAEPLAESESFWLVDPIDGTKSYLRGEDTYTVNIALVRNGIPEIGLVYSPETEKLYYAENSILKIEEKGSPLALGKNEGEIKALVGSRGEGGRTSAFLAANAFPGALSIPSSLKLCLIAAGAADIFPKFSQTMEWDSAAGHALILAAGGDIVDIAGKRILYGKKDFLNPSFIAYGSRVDIKKIIIPEELKETN